MQWRDCSLVSDAGASSAIVLYYHAPAATPLHCHTRIMPSQPDYYAILEVSPSASPEVITSAYRSLARKYHPDANRSPEAGAKMKAINAAYDVLGDRDKRATYDRQRTAAAKVTPAPATPPASPSPAPEESPSQRVWAVLASPAFGAFVVAFIIAYVALAFITDAIAPRISETLLALLAVLVALAATWLLRRPRK